MKIGVICEGHSDRAVIENILKGVADVESSDIIALRPQDLLDETSKSFLKEDVEFSTWSLVKKECEEKELIEEFLLFEGNEFIVIHLDTAEADEYPVVRPPKQNHDYCIEMRERVVSKIDEWIDDEAIVDKILHAVTIEEMDAWVLTIYYDKSTCSSAKPKEKLQFELKKEGISSVVDYENYKWLSDNFCKEKKIRKGNYLDKNCSLSFFVNEIKSKIN